MWRDYRLQIVRISLWSGANGGTALFSLSNFKYKVWSCYEVLDRLYLHRLKYLPKRFIFLWSHWNERMVSQFDTKSLSLFFIRVETVNCIPHSCNIRLLPLFFTFIAHHCSQSIVYHLTGEQSSCATFPWTSAYTKIVFFFCCFLFYTLIKNILRSKSHAIIASSYKLSFLGGNLSKCYPCAICISIFNEISKSSSLLYKSYSSCLCLVYSIFQYPRLTNKLQNELFFGFFI